MTGKANGKMLRLPPGSRGAQPVLSPLPSRSQDAAVTPRVVKASLLVTGLFENFSIRTSPPSGTRSLNPIPHPLPNSLEFSLLPSERGRVDGLRLPQDPRGARGEGQAGGGAPCGRGSWPGGQSQMTRWATEGANGSGSRRPPDPESAGRTGRSGQRGGPAEAAGVRLVPSPSERLPAPTLGLDRVL